MQHCEPFSIPSCHDVRCFFASRFGKLSSVWFRHFAHKLATVEPRNSCTFTPSFIRYLQRWGSQCAQDRHGICNVFYWYVINVRRQAILFAYACSAAWTSSVSALHTFQRCLLDVDLFSQEICINCSYCSKIKVFPGHLYMFIAFAVAYASLIFTALLSLRPSRSQLLRR